MAIPNPTHCDHDPSAEDRMVQSAVLDFLVAEDPVRLTIPELSLAMNAKAGWSSEDAVERAVRDLVGARLLHCEGGFVLPTRTALYVNWLDRA